MKNNKEHDRLIKKIYDELQSNGVVIDKRVVSFIVNHSYLIKKRIIEDPNDYRPIMDRYVGKFVPRKGKVKK